jgi:M6 family metalloprotease-like protein
MKHNLKYLFCVIIFLFTRLHSIAVPASPQPADYTQPDGSVVTYLLKGDEHFKYKTTLDGYLLANNSYGYLNYATINEQGVINCTNIKVNNITNRTKIETEFISNLTPNNNITNIQKARKAKKISSAPTSKQKSYPLVGAPKAIVILVNFSDLSFVTPNPKQAFNDLLNLHGYSTNGGTGSAADYFHDNSMGVFNPEFDVVGPYTLPQKMAFYGANDSKGDDVNPQQMILDACSLASLNGVDLSVYDTDKDGYIDNVFVYYAGYNEAENGPANSIWPHRWVVKSDSTFNGVKAEGYACTSELRSSQGTNMCGIGTFCHEFGHVLGLPDYYPTDGGTHHTLSYWNIMDAGPYLNLGRTPPAYNAWDRLYLDWSRPTELLKIGSYSLDTLTSSNKSYIIIRSEDVNNKNTTEFFTLENRQKKGWDKYLPGHGMLITQINYNQSDWRSNTPNNNKNSMDVDLIEADGIADNRTLPGDPFPGSENITSFTPKFRSTTTDKIWLVNIKELGGIISFDYRNTDFSNQKLTLTRSSDGDLQVTLPNLNFPLEVYDITGKSILYDANPKTNPYIISNLEKHKFYILKFNDYFGKVFVNE